MKNFNPYFAIVNKGKVKGQLISLILIVIIVLSFLMLAHIIYSDMFYSSPPQQKVTDEELVGIWKLKNHWSLQNAQSFIILKNDGTYEIHNPPLYLQRYREPKPIIYESPTCKLVITGKWINGKWSPGIGFKGIDNFGLQIQGKKAPYQLWYSEISPDITPLYKWIKISTQTTCPLCCPCP